jgi:glycosyltransferase
MKISIVTVSYNSAKTINDTIRSVLYQTYPDIEYIIIDGGSNDDTIEIIKSYGDKISKFISEADNGIYDAMNKGLKLATGNFIGILNSDDLYINNSVISELYKQLVKGDFEIFFGDLYYVSKDNTDKIIRRWETKNYKPGAFKKGWHPPHPTFFVSKNVYDKYGYFDLKFKLAADFELMLRFLEKYHVRSCYIPKPLVKMRLGGATNKSIINILKQNFECYEAFKVNGIKVSIFYLFYRLLPKLLQFINK